MGKVVVYILLCVVYLALAWKNPFVQNNLISNLEPYPDTLYYSVPAWNWVHGQGFKMAAYGIEIKPIVPPLYGIYLSPFFKIFNDVRSYYYGNILLGFISIWIFIRLVDEFFGKEKWWLGGGLGLILVTNFYFYNLPSLLMAENLLLPLTLGAMLIGLQKFDNKNLFLTLIVGILLSITKVSSLPVILVLGLMTLFKLRNINKKILLMMIIIGGVGLVLTTLLVIVPNALLLKSVGEVFAFRFAEINAPLFLKQFVGIDGKYLWYNNPQIEQLVGWISLSGLFVSFFLKKFRTKAIWLTILILMVVVFHASMNYAEGRYISTVIPIYLMFIGVWFCVVKNNKIFIVLGLVVLGLYLGLRTNVNGFYERKITTLKRQILNNQLENNEVPWNYKAVENFNKYFFVKNENNYLVTLLTPFYIQYFGNGNYNYLPFSEYQEFSGENKEYIEAMYKKDGNLFLTYEKLLNSGKNIYISNYYIVNYHGGMDSVFQSIEKHFRLSQVSDGCMDLCKIYKLELKTK